MPSQLILNSYPKRAFGSISRSFNAGWYRSRPWLEYSILRDACFCFPCCKFGVANKRDVVFTLRGYTNWKAALERDRGMQKHASSHMQSESELHKLYVTALVIGVSSASRESSFSTLSRVLTPFRRCMLHERKSQLVILAHEKSITSTLDMDEFVRTSARKKTGG